MTRPRIAVLIVLSLVFLAIAVTLRRLHPANVTTSAANQFVVTSAGDAGPGTLRDAILAADRLSTRAHITLAVKRITIETALPALVNPRGTDLDTSAGFGIVDAARQIRDPVLQVMAPASTVRGIRIENARLAGIVVNAPGVQLDGVTVTDSKTGALLGEAGSGCVIRASSFERDETALTIQGEVRDVTIIGTTFRANTRAGLWFVGAAKSDGVSASAREEVRLLDSLFEANGSGAVIANRPALIQGSRFLANHDSGILIMGGAVRVEDSEIRNSGGDAVSVTSAYPVAITHNLIKDNSAAGIKVHDSGITIERNTLEHNGFGIVAIASAASFAPIIRDNTITATKADAITLIGSASTIARNHLLKSGGAGLRTLDLVTSRGEVKAAPELDANVIQGNAVDTPASGIYRFAQTQTP